MDLQKDRRGAVTPFEKSLGVENDPVLSKSEATRYRGIVARGNYLAQDRTDIAYAIKELSKEMSSPKQESQVPQRRIKTGDEVWMPAGSQRCHCVDRH